MSLMRAAIYARVSSVAQRDAHTIENQLQTLPAYVAAQGWTLVGTYVDDGRSAKAGKLEAREGFAGLVKATERGELDVVVVVDVDRLTRTEDMRERAAILGAFQVAGVTIATPASGVLDLRSMMGELYITMQAIFAAEENRKRASRVKAGKVRAIAEGRKPAGPTPYGLAYVRDGGAWSLHPTTAAIVREIYVRVIAGDSCRTIAEDFDARGVPPPRGTWTRAKVWAIVRSRHPVGEWTADKRKHLVVRVPAAVDEATWQAAQVRLIEHGRRGLRRTRHVYLLEGLAVCGMCGSPIAIRSATSARRGLTNPAAYVCRSRKLFRRGEQRCLAPIVPVADIDARVWTVVAAELDNPDLAAEVQRRAEERSANRRDWQGDVASYRAHLARLAKVESGVLGRYRRGAISDEALDTELAAMGRERAAVTAQLATAESAVLANAALPSEQPGAWLAAIRELARNASPEARQRIVRTMVGPPAVLDGRSVRLTLLVEAGSRGVSDDVLVLGSDCRNEHENITIKVTA